MQLIALVIVLLISPFESTADVRFIATSGYFNRKYISNWTAFIGKDPNRLNMDIRLRDAVRYQSLFAESFDVCELVNNVFVDNLMKKWFKNMLKYGNLMENCPMPEGRYYLRDFVVEPSSLAMYLRPGDYRITMRGYFKKLNETVTSGVIDVKWIK